MVAWIITIPASATVAALFYFLVSGHTARALMVGAVIMLALVAGAAWRQVQAGRDVLRRRAGATSTVGFMSTTTEK
jgi:PiT family inorganic phosphate transporter